MKIRRDTPFSELPLVPKYEVVFGRLVIPALLIVFCVVVLVFGK